MRSFTEILESVHNNCNCSCALLPVGCMEQHGPFLPLETDILIADYFSDLLINELLHHSIGAYKYPYVAYSPTRSNSDFAGTVSVEEDVFRGYVKNICQGFVAGIHDFIVIVNGHGPSEPSLTEIAFILLNNQFQADISPKKPVLVINITDFTSEIEKKIGQKSGRHADWRELILIIPILGTAFWNERTIKKMKQFSKENDFTIASPSVLGIPLNFRSIQGVIGEPLPEKSDNLLELSQQVWHNIVKKAAASINTNFRLFQKQFYV